MSTSPPERHSPTGRSRLAKAAEAWDGFSFLVEAPTAQGLAQIWQPLGFDNKSDLLRHGVDEYLGVAQGERRCVRAEH